MPKRKFKPQVKLKGTDLIGGPDPKRKKTDLELLKPRAVFRKNRKYSPAMIETALRRSRGMVSRAAKRLGCKEETIRKYIKDYPVLEQVLWEIREATVDAVEDTLYDQAVNKNNTTAAIFLAKCFGKHRGFVDQPQLNLHAHANAEGMSWLDILKEVAPQLQAQQQQKLIDVTLVVPDGETE